MRCTARDPQGEQCTREEGHDGNHRLEVAHRCHAIACSVRVPPRMLMCKRHWAMVPRDTQRRVWATYREGQCDDKQPAASWHEAADLAIVHVAVLEGHTLSGRYARIVRQLAASAAGLEGMEL
ncbi:conserved hypothetical protein [Virus Rctr197k]|nr:conserved hypothetical protein [Virus Rctr197k]